MKKSLLSLIASILITSYLFSQIPAYIPTNGLVGYWPFNGNANDESGNNLPVNNYFVQFSNDSQRGMVGNFNGNSWLEADTSLFQTQTPITVQFWAKTSNNYSMDVIGQACGNDCGDDIRVQLNAAQCNSTGLSFKNSAFFATAPAQTDNNEWHLFTLIMGSNNNFSYSNFQFFVDGLFIAIGPAQCSHNWGGWAYTPNPSYHFSIGKAGPLGYYFNGLLDDIAIYNRALSPQEITTLYNESTNITGCTNTAACNYNAAANMDDGSCTFPAQIYMNCNGTCINDINGNGICDEIETSIPSYLPANGLVGWWPFNGNANDESGNGNNGVVLTGTTLSSDRFGETNSAYTVDGIDCPNPKGIQLPANIVNDEYTFSLWFKSDDSTKLSQTIINSFPHNFIGVNLNYGEPTWPAQTNKIGSWFGNGSNWLINGLETQWDTFQKQNWKNLLVVKTIASIQFYENGLLVFTQPISELQNPGTIEYFIAGAISINGGGGCYETFKGQLDDIAIYNRALTPSEISNIYTNSTNNTSSNNNNTYLNSVPSGISYQAVARSSQGTALANTVVQVRFTLITDSLSGNIEYVETHSLSTNSLGLFTTAFGTGTAVTGTWGGINWTHSNKYLKVELDAGNGFVDLGTQQLLSSPFAIRAQTAATIDNGSLPVYPNNAAAIAGGLTAGKLYRTSTGDLKVVF